MSEVAGMLVVCRWCGCFSFLLFSSLSLWWFVPISPLSSPLLSVSVLYSLAIPHDTHRHGGSSVERVANDDPRVIFLRPQLGRRGRPWYVLFSLIYDSCTTEGLALT